MGFIVYKEKYTSLSDRLLNPHLQTGIFHGKHPRTGYREGTN